MQPKVAAWTTAVVVIIAASVYIAQAGPGDDAKPGFDAGPFKPVLELEQLMEGQDLLFTSVTSAVRAEKWDDAMVQAWLLAELGNVNTHNAKEKRFADFARNMSNNSAALAKVLKKRNKAQARQAVRTLGQSCKACHDQYRKDEEHEHDHD